MLVRGTWHLVSQLISHLVLGTSGPQSQTSCSNYLLSKHSSPLVHIITWLFAAIIPVLEFWWFSCPLPLISDWWYLSLMLTTGTDSWPLTQLFGLAHHIDRLEYCLVIGWHWWYNGLIWHVDCYDSILWTPDMNHVGNFRVPAILDSTIIRNSNTRVPLMSALRWSLPLILWRFTEL